MSGEVQSVLLPKGKYTRASARNWIYKHGFAVEFNGKGPDSKGNYFRFRQRRPKKGSNYRTIAVGNGIMLIIQY